MQMFISHTSEREPTLNSLMGMYLNSLINDNIPVFSCSINLKPNRYFSEFIFIKFIKKNPACHSLKTYSTEIVLGPQFMISGKYLI